MGETELTRRKRKRDLFEKKATENGDMRQFANEKQMDASMKVEPKQICRQRFHICCGFSVTVCN